MNTRPALSVSERLPFSFHFLRMLLTISPHSDILFLQHIVRRDVGDLEKAFQRYGMAAVSWFGSGGGGGTGHSVVLAAVENRGADRLGDERLLRGRSNHLPCHGRRGGGQRDRPGVL